MKAASEWRPHLRNGPALCSLWKLRVMEAAHRLQALPKVPRNHASCDVQALCSLSRLRTLDAAHNRLQELLEVPSACSLQDLWLDGNQLGDGGALLAALSHATCLTCLALAGNRLPLAELRSSLWAALPGLQQVDQQQRPL